MISIIIPCKKEKNIAEMMIETEKCFPDAQIIVSGDRYGYGKGWALREGLKEAVGEIIVFVDGDLDIHPKEINKVVNGLLIYDIVVGTKKPSGPWHRKVITVCSRLFVEILFGLNMDTQTGLKAFKRDCLPRWKDNSFAFDIEILHKAKKKGYTIGERDIQVTIKKAMPIKSIIRFIYGAIKIKLCLK